MICTNKLVFDWYTQNKQGAIPAIFDKVNEPRHKISIHSVINANAGIAYGINRSGATLHKHAVSNTLSLIRLQLRRMPLWEVLNQRAATIEHRITLARLNRRHLKASNRK